MKNKQLVINMIANIFAFAVNLGINFFFTPYLIKTIGKEAYSFFPLANNFISYVNIITVALNSMASRFITIKIHENNNKGANIYFNSVLISNTLIALFLCIPGILFVVFINKILNIPFEILKEVQFLFTFVFLGMILSILTSVFGVATFARNRLDLSSKRSIESNLIRVISLILMFSLFTPSVAYIGIANLLVIVFVVITNIYFTKKLLPEININKKYFEFKAIKELLGSGIWNSINQLSLVLLTGLDLLIANVFVGVSEAGEYSIVKTIPNFIQQLVGMLVGVFVPQFTILYAQKKQEELLNNINKSIKFMGLIITIPIAFLIIFGDTFFSLWIPNENSKTLYLLSNLTIIPMIVTGSINTIFNVYSVTNKLKIPALVLLITGVLNTMLVFVLIKTTNLGILSIPLVSFVIGLMRNLIFTPIYAARCLEIKWNTFYKAILRGCICAMTMMLFCYAVKVSFNIDSWIKLILAGSVTSVMALVTNLFIIFNKNSRMEILDTILKTIKVKSSINKIIGKSNANKLKSLRSFFYYIRLKDWKKKKKILHLLTPHHGNMGDQAIAYATNKYLKDNFPEYEILEFYRIDIYKYVEAIKKILNEEDLIFLIGGGNMGNLYMPEEKARRFVIENFPENKIISMTQTISFTKDKEGVIELNNTKNIYNNHKALTIIAREKFSFEIMKKEFINCNIIENPDIVLYLCNEYKDNIERRTNIMTCLRNDKESVLGNKKQIILEKLKERYLGLIEYDTVIDKNVYREERKSELEDMLYKFSSSKVVITDRLHGMVFCAVTKTPCIVTKSLDHKVIGTYEWIKDLNYIKLVDNLEISEIFRLIEELTNLKEKSKIDFRAKYFNKLKDKLIR